MNKTSQLLKKFSVYFTITFFLFCALNILCILIIYNLKRRNDIESIISPEKKLELNPSLMQNIYNGKSTNYIAKLQSDCPNNVSHPTLSFMMQPIQNENYTVGLENCRYDDYCNSKSFYEKLNNGIWVFGGSTTFGVNVSSNQTISSYLNLIDHNNSYFNFGVSGYNQSFEINKLILLLKKGFRPKKVIFIDGLNDINQLTYTNFSFSETPAKAHLSYATSFNPENSLKSNNIINQLPIVRLMILINKSHENNFEDIYNSKTLYHQNPLLHYNSIVNYLPKINDINKKVFDYYKSNLILIKNLSESYGFKYQVFFQPNGILYKKNNFVTNYTDFKNELGNYSYIEKSYKMIINKIKKKELDMINISNLDNYTNYPYVDLVHYSSEMNNIIAKEILLHE